MVYAIEARKDVDNILLTKTLVYYSYDNTNKDLAYEVHTRGTPSEHTVKVQVTVQKLGSNYIEEGIVQEGDLVGLFRYEYTQEADGTAIVPTLNTKKGDEIGFLGKRYVIKEHTPATSEDDEIIGFDFTAVATESPN